MFENLRPVFQSGEHKTPLASPKKRSIMGHSIARISSRYQVFETLLWKPREDASQRSSLIESNVSPNITRSSDSFSTVPPIVNGGDSRRTMRDLETTIVLVLLTFNFIPWLLNWGWSKPTCFTIAIELTIERSRGSLQYYLGSLRYNK